MLNIRNVIRLICTNINGTIDLSKGVNFSPGKTGRKEQHMTKMRKLVTLLMAALMLLPSAAAFAEETPDPFMKFDDVVEVHIGQMAYPTQAFPDGDTNEDNVFTRYLLENFNIKVVVD